MGTVAERLLRVPNRFHWWNPILRERHSAADRLSALRDARDRPRVPHRARRCSTKRDDEPPAAEHVTIVANATEVAVNNYAIRRLYKSWRRHRPGRGRARA